MKPVRLALLCAVALCLSPSASCADEIDQSTFDFIRDLAISIKTHREDIRIKDILNVTFANPSITVGNVLSTSETDPEITRLKFTNCSKSSQPFSKVVKLTERQQVTTEWSRVLTTSNSAEVTGKLDLGKVGLSGELTGKESTTNSVAVTNRKTTLLSSDKETTQELKYTVAPWTELTVEVVTSAEQTKLEATVTGIVDAELHYWVLNVKQRHYDMFTGQRLSSVFFSPQPGPRTVTFPGLITVVKSTSTNVSYRERSISADSEECKN